MTWYYCPACKKKLQRGKREVYMAGGKSYCVQTGKDVKLRLVKRSTR